MTSFSIKSPTHCFMFSMAVCTTNCDRGNPNLAIVGCGNEAKWPWCGVMAILRKVITQPTNMKHTTQTDAQIMLNSDDT